MTKQTKWHKWTDEQVNYLKEIADGTPRKIIHKLINKKFNLNLTFNQVVGYMKRNGIRNNIDCKFHAGQKAWNKGMKGLNTGGEKGWFKKGNIPHNKVEVGEEVITCDGYVRVKVQNEGTYPQRFESKARIIYEKHHGPIPGGHLVVFADRNKQNFDIDNLILVSREQLGVMNKQNLIRNCAEHTKTGLLITDLILKTSEINKKLKE